MIRTKTVIIGAGPAGLAMAARLSEAEQEFILLEKEDRVASSWHKHYDRLHLHTTKDFSHLPFKAFPESYPTYVSKDDLIRYFEDYKAAFAIEPKFKQDVKSIMRKDASWHIETKAGESYICEALIIATGFNRQAFLPSWKNVESFKGTVLHSRYYKNPEPYLNQKVLVVGMGNTGAEIALDLSEQDVDVSLSVRGPINIIPRDFLGRPTQKTALLLANFPNWLGDNAGKLLRQLSFGDLKPYGISYPKLAPVEQLRKYGQTPVIDLGTVKRIKQGKIKVFPEIASFSEQTISFKDNKEESFHHVILATGYSSGITEFLAQASDHLNDQSEPKTWQAKDKLYFLGFNAYSPGGLLRSIYLESELIANALNAS